MKETYIVFLIVFLSAQAYTWSMGLIIVYYTLLFERFASGGRRGIL